MAKTTLELLRKVRANNTSNTILDRRTDVNKCGFIYRSMPNEGAVNFWPYRQTFTLKTPFIKQRITSSFKMWH